MAITAFAFSSCAASRKLISARARANSRDLFKVDGYTNEIDPSYGDVETDNDSKVWEWYNEPVTKPQLDLIKKIATSKKAVMRIEGSKYYKDVTISSAQKKAISRVLTLYTGLGGK